MAQGYFQSDSKDYYGGYYGELKISYQTTIKAPGVTEIQWTLYAVGREGFSATTLWTTAQVEINNEQIWSISNSGLSYNNNTIASGSFEKEHEADGTGSFNIKITFQKKYYAMETEAVYSTVVSLETNFPQTACYWDTNSYVKIDKSIQAPGGKIIISWGGAKSGIKNNIAGFVVQYKIDGQVKKSTDVNSNVNEVSLEILNEYRGKTIVARVTIKNTVNSFSNPSKEGGNCLINRLPASPTTSEISKTVPSFQNTISFSVRAGSDNDGQSTSIYYSTNDNNEKKPYTSGKNIEFTKTTTYKFWTFDGLEFSESFVDITITKNIKPECSLGLSGTSFDRTLNIYTDGSPKTCHFGYKYNGIKYEFTTTTSQQYYFGDIRKYLSDNLGSLIQEQTYEVIYWAYINDGIEDSEEVIQGPYSFTVPILNFINNTVKNNYFGKEIDAKIEDGYYYQSYSDFSHINRGNQVSFLEFKRDEPSTQNFKIKLTKSLTRVFAYNFDNLFIPEIIKPYSTATFIISMLGKNGDEYGFGSGSIPTLIIDNKEDYSVSGSSSSDSWQYILTPGLLWGEDGLASSVVNDSTATKTSTLTIINDFGESFTTNVIFNFDFKEIPAISDFEVFVMDNEKKVSLSEFSYIKENIEIQYGGTIKYYGKTLNVEIIDTTKNSIIKKILHDDEKYYFSPWNWNGEKWEKTPRTYSFDSLGSNTIGEIIEDYNTTYKIKVISSKMSEEEETEQISFKRHIPARIHFTQLNYTSDNGGTLTGKFKIDEFGYDKNNTNGAVNQIYFEINEANKNKYQIFPPEDEKHFVKQNGQEITEIINNEEYEFQILYNGFSSGITFQSLAPICETSLEAKYIDNDNENFLAETLKITTNLEYLIVYNILPTVAYRQNYIGINTNNPEKNGTQFLNNSAVTISAYNDHKIIYLVSSNNVSFIDLSTGSLNSFIIDAGSWDNTPGEIAPEIPTGLARIAYTGEIGDLEQTRSDVIVITGGSSIGASNIT